MVLVSRRQTEVLDELEEWREDVRERGIGSRVVLLVAPAGWGRSAVLARFGAAVAAADGPVTVVAGIDGNLPGDRAVQAAALRKALTGIAPPSRAAELLDVYTPAGQAGLGLDVASWFVPGLGAAVSVTGLSRLLGAAARRRDDSPAGEAGAVARAARAVAALSVKVPVVVVLDDADLLDPGLARAMIGGLAGRYDGRVLVVGAARPGSELVAGLVKEAGPDLAGRICRAEVDPGMDYSDRVELARELLPGLPAQAVERVARRTATFGEVFAVAAADMVAGLGPGTGAEKAVAAADAVIDAVLDRAVPSREAAILAWAGGALHQAQAEACLRVLGAGRAGEDAYVRRVGPLACLADPASRRCAEQAAAFSSPQRAGLAAAVLHAVDGPHADIRLQIILLLAELETTPATAEEDLLRLHAAAYNDLGIYPQALSHGRQELALRQRLQHPDHPRTLTTQGNIAAWAGECGDAAGALRLATALLPDLERVLGPDHPSTLGARNNIAYWSAQI